MNAYQASLRQQEGGEKWGGYKCNAFFASSPPSCSVLLLDHPLQEVATKSAPRLISTVLASF
eukprot:11553-Heterococcus_DN1.PRE.2